MRVIAGSLGGRIFASPRGHATHPMSDKVRGALFNALGDIGGLTVLDAFGGSGALSFEAVSRGAESALAVESDKSAQKTIAENISALGLGGQVRLIRATANGWLGTSSPEERFNLVLCDPPYQDLQLNLIARLATRVTEDGLLVLSWPGREPAPVFAGFKPLEAKSYGDAQLLFYEREA